MLDAVQLSDPGRQREINEDAFGRYEPSDAADAARGWLYVVADGMGGHAAGDVASKLAMGAILHEYYESSDWEDPAQGLHLAIVRANDAVYSKGQSDPRLLKMGTTVVAAIVQGQMLTLANVGDSRGYLLREGRLEQLTRDHSWVAKAVEDGVLTLEQARQHPDRNVIYRSLGADAIVEVQTYSRRLHAGDRVLLCSDGLTDVLHDGDIAGIAGGANPGSAAKQLVAEANQRGGPDNITVTLIAVGPADENARRDRPTPARQGVLRSDTPVVHEPVRVDERKTVPRGMSAQNAESSPRAHDDRPTAPKKRQNWLRRWLKRD